MLIVMYGRVVKRLLTGGRAVPSVRRYFVSSPTCRCPSWRCRTLPFQTSSRRDALSVVRCACTYISRFSIHNVDQCKWTFPIFISSKIGGRGTDHAENRLLTSADKRRFTSSSKPTVRLGYTEQETSTDEPQADVIAYSKNVNSDRIHRNSRGDPSRTALSRTEIVRTNTEKGEPLKPRNEMVTLLAACQTPSDVLELALDRREPKLQDFDTTVTDATDFEVHVPGVLDTSPCSLLIACWNTLRVLPPEHAAYEQQRMLQHPRFTALCQQVLRSSRYLTPSLLGYTLAAAARLGIPLRSRLIQTLIRTVQESINEFNGRALGVVASCLPFLLQDRNTEVLRTAITMRAPLALQEVDRVPVLLMLIYHLGPTVPTTLKDKLVAQAWVLFILDQFKPTDIPRLFCSLAQLKHNAPELLSAASSLITENLQELNISDLLQLLKACYKLGYRNTRLFSPIAEHVIINLQLYNFNKVCTLLQLLGKLRFLHRGLLDAVALLLLQQQQQEQQKQQEQVQPAPCHLDKKSLMVLLRVYSLLNYQPHEAADTFLEVLSSALEHRLPELSAIELLMCVRALCILGHRPPSAVTSALFTDDSRMQLLGVSDSLNRVRNELELQAVRLSLQPQKEPPADPVAEASPTSSDPTSSFPLHCPELLSELTAALRGSGQIRVGIIVGGLYCLDAEVTLQEAEALQFLHGDECHPLSDHLHIDGDNSEDRRDDRHVSRDDACILREDSLPESLRVAMLWCHPTDFCLGSKHPCGKLALKIRHLCALGYRVALVSSGEWKRLQPEYRVTFLRRKLQLASGP